TKGNVIRLECPAVTISLHPGNDHKNISFKAALEDLYCTYKDIANLPINTTVNKIVLNQLKKWITSRILLGRIRVGKYNIIQKCCLLACSLLLCKSTLAVLKWHYTQKPESQI